MMRTGWVRCYRTEDLSELSPAEIEAIDPELDINIAHRPIEGLAAPEQSVFMRAGMIEPEEIYNGRYGPPERRPALDFGGRLSLAEMARRSAQSA